MGPNPYESPKQESEPSLRNTLTGWALAKDSVKLFAVGLVASVVGVPILIVACAVLYGFLQYVGVPLP